MAFNIISSVFQLALVAQHALAAPVDVEAPIMKREHAAGGPPAMILRPVQAPGSHALPVQQQVVPQPSATLYFAAATQDDSPEASAAIMSIPKLIYPAVNAVAASAITQVECDGGQARISFIDQHSYDQAAASWTSAGTFTLLTFEDTCGTGTDDPTHDFFLIHSVASHSPETLSILVDVENAQLEDVVDGNTPVCLCAFTSSS